jgi:hypothetical protein
MRMKECDSANMITYISPFSIHEHQRGIQSLRGWMEVHL